MIPNTTAAAMVILGATKVTASNMFGSGSGAAAIAESMLECPPEPWAVLAVIMFAAILALWKVLKCVDLTLALGGLVEVEHIRHLPFRLRNLFIAMHRQ